MKVEDTAKRLLEIANTTEAGPDGRIDVGQVNIVFLREGGKPDDYRAGIEWLKADGMIEMHLSGTFFRFTEKGAQRFA